MNLTDKAKEYLRSGLSVIPVKEDKRPLSSWDEYKVKRMTEEEAKRVFNSWGIAIICGAVSGNLEVIDVDTKYDLSGSLWEDYKRLLEDNLSPEVFNSLIIAQTKSGGYHIYYRSEEIGGNIKLARRPATPQEIQEGDKVKVLLETRGEGGYVVAPPTTGYKYLQGDPLQEIPTISSEDRALILNIARSFNEYQEEAPKYKASTTSATYPQEGLSTFEDYNQRGDIIGLLERHGWKVVNQRGERINLLRPGQTDSKTSGNYHTGKRLLYVWSTSTQFNSEKAYPPSNIYALLECGGDLSEASRRLYREGYGERRGKATQIKTERIKVEVVNSVNRINTIITEPGETLQIKTLETAIGEILITSPGPEATPEVLKAIALIEETGKRIYIKQGTAPEVRDYDYKLSEILNRYSSRQGPEGALTIPDQDRLLEEVIATASQISSPIDRDLFISSLLRIVSPTGITKESLEATVEKLRYKRDKEAQAQEFKKLLDKAKELQDKGETAKGIDYIREKIPELRLQDKGALFAGLREIPTEEDIKLHFSQASESLRSGYYINGEELLLPYGALTGIAGATGHGKTDLLVNLTLNSIRNNPDKEFYFFTYEMSQEAILVRFLNSYLDMDLESHSNQRAIKTYFKTGSTQYIKAEARDLFIEKKDKFFKEFIYSGRLRIKGIDYLSTELNLALSELKKGGKVGGYFIDYFQLLRLPREGYKNYSRQEELKVICQDLKDTAIGLQLPIILCAQFNREVTTPFRLHATNIGEAGDIERILDTLIGIWYTNKSIVSKDLNKAEEGDIRSKGLDIPDKLYTYVLKSRETASDVWELLDYSGKRGVIKNQGKSFF